MAGRFIVFEGIDSEVITDQARRMGEWLRSEGLPVVVTREPTDGPIGAQIRLVLDRRLAVDELTLAALFLADRMDHLNREEDGILTELQRDRYVVCVRYLLSAYAYQSEVAEFEWLKQINQPCPWPDLVIFIDIPVQRCLERLAKQEGYEAKRLEAQKVEMTERRRKYLQAIDRCRLDSNLDAKTVIVKINGNQSDAAIHRECRDLVDRLRWKRSL